MSTLETVPPALIASSRGPTAKEKRYDRQLRLWAASGQAALEDAKIVLLNAGPGVVGVETLKNLILPGCGSFTIVDDAVVGEEDLGVNFFLEEESLGKSRAEESTRLLKELNPEVKGEGIKEARIRFADTVALQLTFTVNLELRCFITLLCVYSCHAHRTLFRPPLCICIMPGSFRSSRLYTFSGILRSFRCPTTAAIPHRRHPSRPRNNSRPASSSTLARASSLRPKKNI